jgi:hypothetical protein
VIGLRILAAVSILALLRHLMEKGNQEMVPTYGYLAGREKEGGWEGEM